MAPTGTPLDGLVLKRIQQAYFQGLLRKTKDCMDDMSDAELYESDLEKVMSEASVIEKVMNATSSRASSPKNTHYVIPGMSTSNTAVYCKVCSNYDLHTDVFIEWRLTSFTNDLR
jgi:hypothetical protein